MAGQQDASPLGTSPEWALANGTPALSGLALCVWRDLDPVRASLTPAWSSGLAEGQVNRLRMLKCQRSGRASFDLRKK